MKLFKAHSVIFIVCCALALLSFFPAAHAQVSSAEIGGVVTDSSGAILPGANVLIVNQGTGARRSTETNQSGAFVVPALEPGNYRVTVEAASFRKTVVDRVTLNRSEERRVGKE